MTENSEIYALEIENLIKLLKRVYSCDFIILNKDHYIGELMDNNFEADKVIFEDLQGNPLKLQHLANLNDCFKNSSDKLSKIFNKSNFNIQAIIPWDNSQYQKLFIEKFIREKQYKGLFKNSACLIGGKFQIKGFAKSQQPDHLKVLRVQRRSKVILKTSNKMKISEILNDPRFKDTHDSVDTTYLFSNGEFTVKWNNCFNVFDWPDTSVDCHVKFIIYPSSKESSLHQILEEIQQLKTINMAVENESSSWSLVDGSTVGLTVNEFKALLTDSLIINEKLSNETDAKMNIWNRNVFKRDKDITEKLWGIVQTINNKSDYKACVNSMMLILTENSNKVQINPNNTTEFCRMLKSRFMSGEVTITSLMTNLELIVQVGLYKLAKDLLFIISNELPDLSHEDCSEIFDSCCRVADLNTGIKSLENLFVCISFLEILKEVLNPPEFKTEATGAIKKFIEIRKKNSDFELNQSMTIKMRGINRNMKSLSSIWIVHYKSTEPIHSHRAVVFEVENSSTEFHVYRHDMELADMKMFGDVVSQ